MPAFFYVSFVPVMVGLALAGLVIYFDHQKSKALIQEGLYRPVSRAQSFQVWGLIVTGVGVALFVGSFWVGLPDLEVGGLVIAFAGLALFGASFLIQSSGSAP